MIPPVCWFCFDYFFGFGSGFLSLGFWFFSGMLFTRHITEILFGIKCPFHLFSSNEARLIREPVYSAFGMQL